MNIDSKNVLVIQIMKNMRYLVFSNTNLWEERDALIKANLDQSNETIADGMELVCPDSGAVYVDEGYCELAKNQFTELMNAICFNLKRFLVVSPPDSELVTGSCIKNKAKHTHWV